MQKISSYYIQTLHERLVPELTFSATIVTCFTDSKQQVHRFHRSVLPEEDPEKIRQAIDEGVGKAYNTVPIDLLPLWGAIIADSDEKFQSYFSPVFRQLYRYSGMTPGLREDLLRFLRLTHRTGCELNLTGPTPVAKFENGLIITCSEPTLDSLLLEMIYFSSFKGLFSEIVREFSPKEFKIIRKNAIRFPYMAISEGPNPHFDNPAYTTTAYTSCNCDFIHDSGLPDSMINEDYSELLISIRARHHGMSPFDEFIKLKNTRSSFCVEAEMKNLFGIRGIHYFNYNYNHFLAHNVFLAALTERS